MPELVIFIIGLATGGIIGFFWGRYEGDEGD